MKHLQQLPDLSKPFQQMKLRQAIAESNPTSFIGQIWSGSVWDNPKQVILEISQQVEDNLPLVLDIMGQKVTDTLYSIAPVHADRYRAMSLTNQIDLC